METKVSRIILREFALSETCDPGSAGAAKIALPDGSHYFIRPKLLPTEAVCRDGKLISAPREFSTYPIVINSNGAPWDEANVWILSVLERRYNLNMATFRGKAEDIQHFRNYIDSRKVDWTAFPENELLRPTYRYRAYLRMELETGSMKWSTARRRMSTVVHFYRWLITNKLMAPDHAPWIESDVYIPTADPPVPDYLSGEFFE